MYHMLGLAQKWSQQLEHLHKTDFIFSVSLWYTFLKCIAAHANIASMQNKEFNKY